MITIGARPHVHIADTSKQFRGEFYHRGRSHVLNIINLEVFSSLSLLNASTPCNMQLIEGRVSMPLNGSQLSIPHNL